MNEVDSIRLEELRQLKKGIRGSKEHLIVPLPLQLKGVVCPMKERFSN